MARQYQLKQPEYQREFLIFSVRSQLWRDDPRSLLYPPLSAEMRPIFEGVLAHLEAGTPLSDIHNLTTVDASLDADNLTKSSFSKFKKNYRALTARMAQAPAPPTSSEVEELFDILREHPATASHSCSAWQMVRDFSKYPIFAESEYCDSRYVAELQDRDWSCDFWQSRFHQSLQVRHLNSEPAPAPDDVFASDEFPWVEKPVPSIQFDNPPKVIIENRVFLFTGKFDYGPRRKCVSAVIAKGGRCEENMTRAIDCLVVAGGGEAAEVRSGKTRAWQDFRKKGWPCLLISEEQWRKWLEQP